MEEIILHCEKIIRMINDNYKSQTYYSGTIKRIYDIANQICNNVNSEIVEDIKVDWAGLARNFVDETTDYTSPILFEMEKIQRILNT